MAIYSNISIDQGSTFSSIVTVEGQNGLAFNLTGYTARGQIRKSYASSTAISFATSIASASAGQISLSLTATQTGNLKPGRYVYDVEVVNGDVVVRVVEGQIEVNPRVTRV
jgi:hypothetical protein